MSEITAESGVPLRQPSKVEARHRRETRKERFAKVAKTAISNIVGFAREEGTHYTSAAELDRQILGIPDYVSHAYGEQVVSEHERHMSEYPSTPKTIEVARLELPYPADEHLPLPQGPFDVVAEELRRYPDGQSFRDVLAVFDKLDGRQPFCLSMRDHAAATFLIQHLAKQETPTAAIPMFYQGALFGAHCAMEIVSDADRSKILGTYVDIAEGHDRQLGESANSALKRMNRLYGTSFDETGRQFEELDDARKALLEQAAQYASKTGDPAEKACFGRGFLFATQTALRILEEHIDASPS